MTDKRLEDVFNEVLTGDVLKNALDFVEFLNANGITQIEQHGMYYKGECVCYIDTRNEHPSWIVWTAGDYSNEYEDFPIDGQTKETAWTHANKCGNCEGTDCSPGKTKVIFGKSFANICNGADVDMCFTNPSGETLASLKKLVEMRKNIIANRR
ncbi:MAG: hypothetical protein FWD03_09080 [Defluviitaleaceae bacterium]|nr:hypothetical protein [Defluviitaleaceae bacterium]